MPASRLERRRMGWRAGRTVGLTLVGLIEGVSLTRSTDVDGSGSAGTGVAVATLGTGGVSTLGTGAGSTLGTVVELLEEIATEAALTRLVKSLSCSSDELLSNCLMA